MNPIESGVRNPIDATLSTGVGSTRRDSDEHPLSIPCLSERRSTRVASAGILLSTSGQELRAGYALLKEHGFHDPFATHGLELCVGVEPIAEQSDTETNMHKVIPNALRDDRRDDGFYIGWCCELHVPKVVNILVTTGTKIGMCTDCGRGNVVVGDIGGVAKNDGDRIGIGDRGETVPRGQDNFGVNEGAGAEFIRRHHSDDPLECAGVGWYSTHNRSIAVDRVWTEREPQASQQIQDQHGERLPDLVVACGHKRDVRMNVLTSTREGVETA